MTITVHQAVALPTGSAYASYSLPKGFPLLVIDEQSKIIEPVLLFQLDKLRRSGARRSWWNTAMAEAYDLKDWFDYLAHRRWTDLDSLDTNIGKPWDLAGESDYVNWREVLHEIVSPKTNQLLASNTISRRQGTVERFYSHAQKKGWYAGDFVVTKVAKGTRGSKNIRGHTASDAKSSETQSAYKEPYEFGEPVRPLTADEWARLKRELGPLPSERGDDLRRSRDRLADEWALSTGMRVDEVASLTEFQLHNLHQLWITADIETREKGFFILHITKTKRAKPRNVEVPGYLIPELMNYFHGEREASIKQGMERALRQGATYKRPTSLFVNHAESTQHSGNAISATSLSWAFKQACLRAGITEYVEKIDIDTGERYRVNLARHCFHDLRHTFAKWRYEWRVAEGDSEPWKDIQILLGHSSLQVTLDVYLAVVSNDRRSAGAKQYAAKKMIGERNA